MSLTKRREGSPAELFATAFVCLLIDRNYIRRADLDVSVAQLQMCSASWEPAAVRRAKLLSIRQVIQYTRLFGEDCMVQAIRTFEEDVHVESGPHGFVTTRYNIVAILDEFWGIGQTLSAAEIDAILLTLTSGKVVPAPPQLCKVEPTPRRRSYRGPLDVIVPPPV